MKRISFWAKSHRWSARFLVLMLYIPFNVAAISTGEWLYTINGPLPVTASLGCVLLLVIAMACFKSPRDAGRHARYNRRMICHLAMLSATFGLIACTTIRMQQGSPVNALSATATAAAIGSAPAKAASDLTKRNTKPGTARYTFRQLRKLLRGYAALPGRPLTQGEKVVFVVLSIIGGVVLTLLLAASSCSIACSGGEAIALVLLIAGGVGIAIGLTALIRHITRSPTKRNVAPYAFQKKVFAFARRRG